ncbi:MAG TPA: lipopolysaccharide core heptose(II) kinase RfaY [archaeon]|nr:lipopolysaccharide core heptose(II) kinase RfaY [archaeon]
MKKIAERLELFRIDARNLLRQKTRDAGNLVWLRTRGFRRVNLRGIGKFPVPDASNAEKKETPVSMWLRKPIQKPQTWDIKFRIGNAYLFETPGNKFYFLKKVGTRTNPTATGYTGTESVKNLFDMLRAGVKTESPVGLLMTAEGNDYLISVPKKGAHLFEALLHANTAQKIKIETSLATQLAKLHNAGMVHGHLHGDNIIVYSGMARIIDSTEAFTSKKAPTEKLAEMQNLDFKRVNAICRIWGDAGTFERVYNELRKKIG